MFSVPFSSQTWAAPSEFGTYRLCDQRRFRRACASAQSRQNLRCSLIQAVSQEEPSDRKPDPWSLWMARHAQLKFVMSECSKTQIRLARHTYSMKLIAGSAAVTAVAFNEKVLADYGRDPTNTTDQDTLIQIAMDFIEKQHSHVKLNRKYKILEKTHKGSIKMIQEALTHAFRTKDKDIDNETAKVLGNFAPLGMESPESLIGQLNSQNDQSDTIKQTELASDRMSGISLNPQPIKKGLIEEIDSSEKSLPEPVYEINISRDDGTKLTETITVKISLPGVTSVSQCELDISKVMFFSCSWTLYQLSHVWDYSICDIF